MFYKQLPDQTRNEKVEFFTHEKHTHSYRECYFKRKKDAVLSLKATSIVYFCEKTIFVRRKVHFLGVTTLIFSLFLCLNELKNEKSLKFVSISVIFGLVQIKVSFPWNLSL